jgi:predicted TIM-barrel fold metal-dependent hydrolase
MRCPSPIEAAPGDDELLRRTLEIMERRNIWAVASGDREKVRRWQAAARGRIIPATGWGDEGGRLDDPAVLRRLVAEGRFRIFSEIAPQYAGLAPNDDSLEPYFALAEALDVPVGLHLGEGPPGGAYVLGAPGAPSPYRVAAGRPLLLEDVLVRHPRLRIWVMHFGSPFVEEMIAILYSHPQVFVDVAQNDWGFPRAEFHDQLRRLVEAGFGKRILFGSDSIVWPQTIEIAIESIESADFLTQDQKRDILYGNAARFLRLGDEEIARHHGRPPAGE